MAPKRSTCVPPALVEVSPPIVALPLAPSDKGNRLPTAAAASCSAARIVPASQTALFAAAEIERILFIRRIESRRALPSGLGTAPATIEVFPPCGTNGTRSSAHRRTISATSSVLAGDSIAAAAPRYRSRQSISQGDMSA